MKELVRIEAPHFVAGIIIDFDNDKVLNAAPIVKYMKNWTWSRASQYCDTRNWKWEILDEQDRYPF